MIDSLEEFISKVDSFESLAKSIQCDYFIYFLTEFKKYPGVSPKDIEECFSELKLHKYSNIPQYLQVQSAKGRNKNPKFLVDKGLYHLERKRKAEISGTVLIDKPFIETSKTLRDLLSKLQNSSEKAFLTDAIKAFEVEAFRAAIVMVWILTLDHLFEYILNNKLLDFNQELDKARLRINEIKVKDDFSDIKEGKFIELCRASNIISNDVRKILVDSLDTRNSAAHPSNIIIGRGKAFEFIEDLVNNVITKY